MYLCNLPINFLSCSKNESTKPWLRPDDTPERNEKAKKAYEALLTVTLRKPTSRDYKNFSKEVKRRAKERYENFTYGEEEVMFLTFGSQPEKMYLMTQRLAKTDQSAHAHSLIWVFAVSL